MIHILHPRHVSGREDRMWDFHWGCRLHCHWRWRLWWAQLFRGFEFQDRHRDQGLLTLIFHSSDLIWWIWMDLIGETGMLLECGKSVVEPWTCNRCQVVHAIVRISLMSASRLPGICWTHTEILGKPFPVLLWNKIQARHTKTHQVLILKLSWHVDQVHVWPWFFPLSHQLLTPRQNYPLGLDENPRIAWIA